jgi:hypothetical protein
MLRVEVEGFLLVLLWVVVSDYMRVLTTKKRFNPLLVVGGVLGLTFILGIVYLIALMIKRNNRNVRAGIYVPPKSL